MAMPGSVAVPAATASPPSPSAALLLHPAAATTAPSPATRVHGYTARFGCDVLAPPPTTNTASATGMGSEFGSSEGRSACKPPLAADSTPPLHAPPSAPPPPPYMEMARACLEYALSLLPLPEVSYSTQRAVEERMAAGRRPTTMLALLARREEDYEKEEREQQAESIAIASIPVGRVQHTASALTSLPVPEAQAPAGGAGSTGGSLSRGHVRTPSSSVPPSPSRGAPAHPSPAPLGAPSQPASAAAAGVPFLASNRAPIAPYVPSGATTFPLHAAALAIASTSVSLPCAASGLGTGSSGTSIASLRSPLGVVAGAAGSGTGTAALSSGRGGGALSAAPGSPSGSSFPLTTRGDPSLPTTGPVPSPSSAAIPPTSAATATATAVAGGAALPLRVSPVGSEATSGSAGPSMPTVEGASSTSKPSPTPAGTLATSTTRAAAGLGTAPMPVTPSRTGPTVRNAGSVAGSPTTGVTGRGLHSVTTAPGSPSSVSHPATAAGAFESLRLLLLDPSFVSTLPVETQAALAYFNHATSSPFFTADAPMPRVPGAVPGPGNGTSSCTSDQYEYHHHWQRIERTMLSGSALACCETEEVCSVPIGDADLSLIPWAGTHRSDAASAPMVHWLASGSATPGCSGSASVKAAHVGADSAMWGDDLNEARQQAAAARQVVLGKLASLASR